MSFPPQPETLESVLRLERFAREIDKASPLCSLYAFYCVHSGEDINIPQMKRYFGTYRQKIERVRDVLESFGFIKVSSGKGKMDHIVADDVFTLDPDPDVDPTATTTKLISYLSTPSSISKREERETEERRSRGQPQFTVEDISADPDWKKAEEVLKKYFKPHQIHPKMLTYGDKFAALCDLLSDATIDFDAYCRWYRTEKYPLKKFNFGLFLHAGMIAEYKDSIEDDAEAGRYLNTATMHESDSFKKDLEQKKKMFKKMGIAEDG